MTYRVDYREVALLTKTEHRTVVDAIETWAADDSTETRRFPWFRRNRLADETEVKVIIEGLSYDEVAAMQEVMRDGLDTLPGEWPDPTTSASIIRE